MTALRPINTYRPCWVEKFGPVCRSREKEAKSSWLLQAIRFFNLTDPREERGLLCMCVCVSQLRTSLSNLTVVRACLKCLCLSKLFLDCYLIM